MEISIYGQTTLACLDTGAMCSLLPLGLFREIFASDTSITPPTSFMRVIGVSGTEIPIFGCLRKVPVQICGVEIEGNFIITDDTNCPRDNILLGCNLLQKVHDKLSDGNIIPDIKWSRVFQCLSKHISTLEAAEPIVHPEWDIFADKTQILKPGECREISCQLTGPDVASSEVIYWEDHLIKSVSAGRTRSLLMDYKPVQFGDVVLYGGYIENPKAQKITICVLNSTKECMNIPRGAKLAKAYSGTSPRNEITIYPTDADASTWQIAINRVITANGPNDEECTATHADDADDGPTIPESESTSTFTFTDGTECTLPPDIKLPTHVSTDIREQLVRIIIKHRQAFAMSEFDIGRCDLLPFQIKMMNDKPFCFPYRRIPQRDLQDVRKFVQKLLDNGIIEYSTSEYGSPAVVLRKKNGSVRLTIDYRHLNANSVSIIWPMNPVEDLLEVLGGSQAYTNFDLCQGYFHVINHPDTIPLTAFRLPFGHFQFLRQPQGNKQSPAHFAKVIEMIFGDMNLVKLILYLDDILAFGSDFQSCLETIEEILTRLIKHGLKISGRKCSWLEKEVKFLGYTITQAGLAVDLDKIEKVLNWPNPTTVQDLRKFIGLASYFRRFVKSFAMIAKPLYALLPSEKGTNKKLKLGPWTPEAEASFNTLKSVLTTTPVLAHPDLNKEYILEVDASLIGLGAVLSRKVQITFFIQFRMHQGR